MHLGRFLETIRENVILFVTFTVLRCRTYHATLILLVVFASLLILMQQQQPLSEIFSSYAVQSRIAMIRGISLVEKQCRETLCKDFSRQMSDGLWVDKPGLTDEDIKRRKDMDLLIRVDAHWPANLFRNDSRCGKGYPLPGYRIQSLCNPDGPAPCCDTKTGECGISERHCKCPECTDLRDFKSAELVDWLPVNEACALKNFTKNQACDFMNKNNIRLAFIGDSVIRQLFTTMLLILSGNPQSGSVPRNASKSELSRCAGELQLTQRDCSIGITAHSMDVLPLGSICDGATDFQLHLLTDYGSSLQTDVLDKIKEMLGQKNSYVVLGVGFHYGLNSDYVISNFISKVTRLVENGGHGWPRIIWMELHSLNGFLRMETKFHNDRIFKFNSHVNDYLEKRNITVLRTFEKSKILKSYDGQHYGLGFNLHKIQMILNLIESEYQKC
eukprot:gene217-832_t